MYFIRQFDTGHKTKPGTSESTGSKEVPSLSFRGFTTDQAAKEVSTAEDELKKAMQARRFLRASFGLLSLNYEALCHIIHINQMH